MATQTEKLTYAQVYERIEHSLGGRPSALMPAKRIADMAGEHLYAMHPWNWAKRRQAFLDLRGKISLTTATWTAATRTLTQTGAFANYTFLSKDRLEITGGTGATTGHYAVESRTDDDNIVLETSLASGNLATGDITGELTLDTISLPIDYGGTISISHTNSVLYGIKETTLEQILRARTSQVDVTSDWDFWGAINYVGDPLVPIYEIWPAPSENQTGAISLFYRSKWPREASDQASVALPEFVHPLYLELASAFARGVYEEDNATLSQRVMEVAEGPICMAAKQMDGRTQRFYGTVRGGGARIHTRNRPRDGKTAWLASFVGAPSP